MLEAMIELYCDLFARLKLEFGKFVKFSKFLYGNYRKSSTLQSFTALFMFASLLCFLLVMLSTYFFIFPSPDPVFDTNQIQNSRIKNPKKIDCNVFDGKWVIDETKSYPLYNASDCPFLENGFNCLANGRKDKDYLKWRWKPRNCEIPRFNVHSVLEYLRGKRVVFVGDSLSRTQWESMICMLMSGVEDKRTVFEAHGNEITKRIEHLVVVFRSFGLTVEFYRSVFLVASDDVLPRHSPKRVKAVVKLDELDEVSREWVDSDILVFNSGHWWNPTKLFKMGWYFEKGGKLKLGMPINNGFKAALNTWRSWLDNSVNPNRTRVFFRTFESTHWGGSRQNCKVTKHPLVKPKGKQKNAISDAIIATVKRSSIPVQLLHVTPMSAFRSDAHVGSWSDNPSVPDCSHWCLPGVPDVWNELLFSFLLPK